VPEEARGGGARRREVARGGQVLHLDDGEGWDGGARVVGVRRQQDPPRGRSRGDDARGRAGPDHQHGLEGGGQNVCL